MAANQRLVPKATPVMQASLPGQSGVTQSAEDEVGGQDDPEEQHARVGHDAHEAGHEGRVRVEFFLDAVLDAVGGGGRGAAAR